MLSLGLARVSEAAALASADFIGRGDEKAADQAAVNGMREQLNKLEIRGTVVIGEGERDEAPMLYIGEEVGDGTGPEVDIALDPLGRHHPDRQGHAQRADRHRHGSARIDAARPRRLHGEAGDRPRLPPRCRDARHVALRTRQRAGARAKGCSTTDITVCVLERPRHQAMIDELRTTGLRHPPDHRRGRRGRESTAPSPRSRASTCTWAKAARPRAFWPPPR